ncbi:unnamed protein product [Brassica oleracea var. botrytis]|uniref:(rape) hypothetical protein n=1 Tax=Brassica napus TaxID=3708 RepID=A0A816RTN1_BRANA|nr:unnamed protein product [Brassica napus]
MSTTKIWLQAISRIQTGKQNSIAIRAKIVSLLPCPWSNRSSKSQIVTLYSYGFGWLTITHSMNSAGILVGVQFLQRAKITGKKITAGLIFSSHWTQHSGNCVLTECIALVLFSAAYMPYILHNLCFKNNDARGEDLEAGGGGLYH